MKCTFRKLTSKDLSTLIDLVTVYENVFEMKDFKMPLAEHLQTLLTNEKIIFYVAFADKEVIGGLTAYILPSVYFVSGEVYIYDFAVETSHQRKGVGRQLMDELKAYCKQQGYKEIFVQAHIVDRHALDFYHATGGQQTIVAHYSYDLGNS